MGTNIRKRPILRAFLTSSICPLNCSPGDKKSGKPDITAFQRGDKFVPACPFEGTKCQNQTVTHLYSVYQGTNLSPWGTKGNG